MSTHFMRRPAIIEFLPKPRPNPIIRLDRELLEEKAGVTIDWTDIQLLVWQITIYAGRSRDPSTNRRSRERDIRRAFVQSIYNIWIEALIEYRTGPGRAVYRDSRYAPKGPLIRFLQELFRAAGERPPSATTLYWDIQHIFFDKERRH